MVALPESVIQKDRYTLIDEETGFKAKFDGLTANAGPNGIDLRSLTAKFAKVQPKGLKAYDPGAKSTMSCADDTSLVEGQEGILLYRGYNILELTDKCTYPEIVYLLLEGRLPTQEELDAYERKMIADASVSERITRSIFDDYADGLKPKPMAILASAVNKFAAFDDGKDPHRIVMQLPIMAATIVRAYQGKTEPVPVDPNLSFMENIVRISFAEDGNVEEYVCDPDMVRAMEVMYILHADHGQNLSTSTGRNVRSGHASVPEAVAAAINALNGPLHGGANAKVLGMLQDIAARPEPTVEAKVDAIIAKAKDPNDPFRIMGFGHRVYKNIDPRGVAARKHCARFLERFGTSGNELLQIATTLKERALADEYFTGTDAEGKTRGLFPNIDFDSGHTFAAMDLESELFTLPFAACRVTGWVRQMENHIEDGVPITRPYELNLCPEEKPVPDIRHRIGANGAPPTEVEGPQGGTTLE